MTKCERNKTKYKNLRLNEKMNKFTRVNYISINKFIIYHTGLYIGMIHNNLYFRLFYELTDIFVKMLMF